MVVDSMLGRLYVCTEVFDNAGIAQLVEHNLAKVGVASSSLVSRSTTLVVTSSLCCMPCRLIPP